MNRKLLGLAGVVFSLCMMTSASAFADTWATIVVDRTTNSWGSSYGSADQYDSDQAALNNCGAGCSNPNDAFTYQRAVNGWAAVATDGAGHFGTAGVHDSQADAEQSALNNCGADCYILRSLASY
jgi:hypothetical protein